MSKNHWDIPFYWYKRLLEVYPRLAEAIFPEGIPDTFHKADVLRVDRYIEREFAGVMAEGL